MLKFVQLGGTGGGFEPHVTNIFGPPARADRLKIFTLNRQDRVIFAECLRFGVKALIGTVER